MARGDEGTLFTTFMDRTRTFHALIVETVEQLREIGATTLASPHLRREDDILVTVEEGRELCQSTLENLKTFLQQVTEDAVATEADLQKLERMRATFDDAISRINNRVLHATQKMKKDAQQQAKQNLQVYRQQRGGAALRVPQFVQGTIQAAKYTSSPPLQRHVPTAQDMQRLQVLLRGRPFSTFMRDLKKIQEHVQQTLKELRIIAQTKQWRTADLAALVEEVRRLCQNTLRDVEALKESVLDRDGAVTEEDRTRLQAIDTAFHEAIDPLSQRMTQGVQRVDMQKQQRATRQVMEAQRMQAQKQGGGER